MLETSHLLSNRHPQDLLDMIVTQRHGQLSGPHVQLGPSYSLLPENEGKLAQLFFF